MLPHACTHARTSRPAAGLQSSGIEGVKPTILASSRWARLAAVHAHTGTHLAFACYACMRGHGSCLSTDDRESRAKPPAPLNPIQDTLSPCSPKAPTHTATSFACSRLLHMLVCTHAHLSATLPLLPGLRKLLDAWNPIGLDPTNLSCSPYLCSQA